MQWYVLNYDFNQKKVNYFDIFNSSRFNDCIKEMRETQWNSVEDFIERLDSVLRYCFWSKREYEISVGDAFETDCKKLEKIDVYSQVKPNINMLAKYILIEWANEDTGE